MHIAIFLFADYLKITLTDHYRHKEEKLRCDVLRKQTSWKKTFFVRCQGLGKHNLQKFSYSTLYLHTLNKTLNEIKKKNISTFCYSWNKMVNLWFFIFNRTATIGRVACFRSVSFILGFCTPSGASRVVCICSNHFHLLAPWATRLLSHGECWLVASQWQHRAWSFPCTHPLTPSTKLDRTQVLFFKSSEWPDRESSWAYQLWWRVLNQPYYLYWLLIINFVEVMYFYWYHALNKKAE